ncbi:MAG: PKD-like domain-containing protein, partial [Pseudomonadota bacterium]
MNGGSVIVPANTRYSWNPPAVSNASLTGGLSASNQTTVNGILTNNSNITRTAVYIVTPTATLGTCVGATFTVLVSVNPRAVINQITQVICSGASFQVTPTDLNNGIVPAGTVYNWSAPAVTTASLTGGQPSGISRTSVFGTLRNERNTVQTATYTVVPTTLDCGANNPFTVLVTVNPKPEISVLSTVVCSGLTFEVSPVDKGDGVFIVPVGTRYRWSTPSVSTASLAGGQSDTNRLFIFGTLTNNTNVQQSAVYSVTPTAPAPGSCEGAAFTLVVYIDPKAVITPMSTTVCSGLLFNVTPTNGQNGIVPAGTRYTWISAPAVSSVSLTGGVAASLVNSISGTLHNGTNTLQTAVYTVTPVTVDCSANNPFTVTVFVNPTPEITAMTKVVCSGVTFEVSPANFVNGIVPQAISYRWNEPLVSTPSLTGGQSAANQPNISGKLTSFTNDTQTATYTIIPTGTNGSCEGAAFTLTVTVNPGGYVNEMSTTVCSGYPFNITPTNGTNGIIPFGTTFGWEVPAQGTAISGGQSATGQQSVFGRLSNNTNTAKTAVYTVVPNIPNCGTGYSTFTLTVYVNPTPVISPLSTVTCSGVSFAVSPVNGGSVIVPANTRYEWDAPAVSNISLTGGLSASNQTTVNGVLT